MSKVKTSKVDKLGMITSGICAIHCSIPVLFSLGFIGSFSTSGHVTFDICVLFLSTALGIRSIMNGLRLHGAKSPQLLIVAGIFLIAIGLLIPVGSIGMLVGGMMLIMGHWWNARLAPNGAL